MHIVLIIGSLSSGGAERAFTTLANTLCEKGYNITIIAYPAEGTDPFYVIDPRIRVIYLGIVQESKNYIQSLLNSILRITVLRKKIVLLKPSYIISFCTEINVEVILSSRFLPCRVIVSERSNPKVHPNKKIWRLLRTLCYQFADEIILQTNDVRSFFQNLSNIKVIPNILSVLNQFKIEVPLPEKFIVTIGRLSPEKSQDSLILAFSNIADKYLDWSLVIVGEGHRKQELKDLIKELQLESRVHLLGSIKNPESIMCKAEIFVLSSQYEGFPNALCEAMSLGIPVISYDCDFGPREIISNGIDGILVPLNDINALTMALEHLINDNNFRKQLGENARSIARRLSSEYIFPKWEIILK